MICIPLTPDAATLHTLELFLARVHARFPDADAILFGSRARGCHRPDSDADVAVLLGDTPGNFLPTKLALADLAFDVLLETGVRAEPVPIWPNEWAHPEAYSNPRLLENIAREGVRL